MSLDKAGEIAATGLRAQKLRLRVIAENLANAESTAAVPGGEPYRRKLVTFRAALDELTPNARTVEATAKARDPGDFERRFDPAHPAANDKGYVLLPNVNPLIELADMRAAQRSYQANLAVIEAADDMKSRLTKLLDSTA